MTKSEFYQKWGKVVQAFQNLDRQINEWAQQEDPIQLPDEIADGLRTFAAEIQNLAST